MLYSRFDILPRSVIRSANSIDRSDNLDVIHLIAQDILLMTKPTPTQFSGGFIRPNQHIVERLQSINAMMLEAFNGGASMSSSTKGNERELFVNFFLSPLFPNHFRFGTGDITDSFEAKSGQIDIVIEFPNLYSFPVVQGGPRLYLAEGVAVAIEVKSNLKNQWPEVVATATKLKALKRRFKNDRLNELADRYEDLGDHMSAFNVRERASRMVSPGEDIPLYVVGYNGWSKASTLARRLRESPVDGILQLDTQFFALGHGDAIFDDFGPISLMVFLEFIRGHLNNQPQQATMFHYATEVESESPGNGG